MEMINGDDVVYKKLLMGLFTIVLAGCAVSMPFNNRLSFTAIKDMMTVDKMNKKIAIQWQPTTFPTKVDIQGADAFIGSLSRTRVPTGPGLTSRVEEAISTFTTLSPTGEPLVIKINYASSGFEYSAGTTNVVPSMDVGSMRLNATFTFEGKTWSNIYISKVKDPTIGGSTTTSVLEAAWDNIAVQVAKDVATHIKPQQRFLKMPSKVE
ncbi:hypothetical protein [Rouxiella sp. Mn2063]|uniref:hypothetical protein n=1 Tax=Rouxiella sp. Mn2063 TaxID=3395262 RepID=UPI003BC7061C